VRTPDPGISKRVRQEEFFRTIFRKISSIPHRHCLASSARNRAERSGEAALRITGRACAVISSQINPTLLFYRQMADRTRPIVRPGVRGRMVTNGYQKGVYEWVTKGIWASGLPVAPASAGVPLNMNLLYENGDRACNFPRRNFEAAGPETDNSYDLDSNCSTRRS
jgi:hypothetical protein